MSERNIRLIGLDLDGTVFNENKEITPLVSSAIKRAIAKGVIVLPATGRPVTGLPRNFIDIPGVNYALTSNGAAVVDLRTGERIYEDCLTPEYAAKVLKRMISFAGLAEAYIHGQCYTHKKNFEQKAYMSAIPEALVQYIKKTRKPVADLPGFVAENGRGIEKLHMLFSDMKERESAFEVLRKEFPELTITEATPFNMEINAPNCNKGKGLLALGRILGIDRGEIMACGDSYNDLPMLKAVGFAVAMGNGAPQVKAAADFVTLSNEEDGVAYAIEKFVLKDGQKRYGNNEK